MGEGINEIAIDIQARSEDILEGLPADAPIGGYGVAGVRGVVTTRVFPDHKVAASASRYLGIVLVQGRRPNSTVAR